jgi:hypothetical protein
MIDLIRLIIVTLIIDWDSIIHGLPAIIFFSVKLNPNRRREKHFISIENKIYC